MLRKIAGGRVLIFSRGWELNVLRSLKVSDVVKQSIELVNEKVPFTKVLEKMVGSIHNYIYVVNDSNKITGYISMQEIRQTIMDYDTLKNLLIARDVVKPKALILKESDNLDYVMKEFGREGIDELPVVSGNGDGKIVGTIWQTDVISAYNHQVFLRDMSGETGHSIRKLSKEKTVHVIDQYHFNEIEAPASFLGKTLEKIAVRKKFNIELLLIKRNQKIGKSIKTLYIQPHGQTVLEMNDILLIFGAEKDIKRFAKV